MASDDEVNRFYVGESYCGLTLLPVAKCRHCTELAAQSLGRHFKVTEVDYEAGTVTIEDPGE